MAAPPTNPSIAVTKAHAMIAFRFIDQSDLKTVELFLQKYDWRCKEGDSTKTTIAKEQIFHFLA